MNVHADIALAEPWHTPWPADGLETIGACPVCGGAARSKMHEGLVDNFFRCAPGMWKMWRCSQCRCAYLDPRPTRETIGAAYRQYFTHAAPKAKQNYAALGVFRRMYRRLVNGFINRRFGAQASPASVIGPLVLGIIPPLRVWPEWEHRSLPGPGGGRRLLELGSGNGSFLAVAANCGWRAEGLDLDPMAVARSAQLGLTAQCGGIERFDGRTELFDAVVTSHVIEHLHDPVTVLRACHRLLRPGGTIWVETPNIDSQGYRLFGSSWSGLDPPRHLIVFNPSTLRHVMSGAGFVDIHACPRPSACPGTFRASHHLLNGESPFSTGRTPLAVFLRARLAALIELLRPDERDFCVLAARKPIA